MKRYHKIDKDLREKLKAKKSQSSKAKYKIQKGNLLIAASMQHDNASFFLEGQQQYSRALNLQPSIDDITTLATCVYHSESIYDAFFNPDKSEVHYIATTFSIAKTYKEGEDYSSALRCMKKIEPYINKEIYRRMYPRKHIEMHAFLALLNLHQKSYYEVIKHLSYAFRSIQAQPDTRQMRKWKVDIFNSIDLLLEVENLEGNQNHLLNIFLQHSFPTLHQAYREYCDSVNNDPKPQPPS